MKHTGLIQCDCDNLHKEKLQKYLALEHRKEIGYKMRKCHPGTEKWGKNTPGRGKPFSEDRESKEQITSAL